MTIKLFRESLYKNDAKASYSNVDCYQYHSEDKHVQFTAHDGRFECILLLKEGDAVVIDRLGDV